MYKFDISYVTTDSISEGVGSSQILPLVSKLSGSGLKVNLISYEKTSPSEETRSELLESGVLWTPLEFRTKSGLGGLSRMFELRKVIQASDIIHARSDIPAMSGILSGNGPVLWDVRSLWADQRMFSTESSIEKQILKTAKLIERFNCGKSVGMSTLTNQVVPVFAKRYRKLPEFRIVVPTAVDLERFKLVPIMPKQVRALYSGTFNRYYDLKLSKEFTDYLSSLTAIEIGWARPKEAEGSVLGVGESNIFALTQNQMANILGDYSFGMSVCRNDAGVSLKAAMPTKIAEFLASGRPVVVNKGLGDFDDFLAEFTAGVILDGTRKNLIEGAEQLLALISDPETPIRCRALAEKYFGLNKGVGKYLDLYKMMSSL